FGLPEVVDRELKVDTKRSLNRQLSSGNSRTFKELLAQFHAQLTHQSLANPVVGRTYLFGSQCPVFVTICQRVREGFSSRGNIFFLPANEEVEQLDCGQERFPGALDRAENFLVGQRLRSKESNIAADRGKTLQLAKFARLRGCLQLVRQIHL